jgi:hypothetical protein
MTDELDSIINKRGGGGLIRKRKKRFDVVDMIFKVYKAMV